MFLILRLKLALWLDNQTSWKALKSWNEGWMKDEWRMMKDKGWRLKVEGWWFQGVLQTDRQTDGWMDICDCGVAFATENVSDFRWWLSCVICITPHWWMHIAMIQT